MLGPCGIRFEQGMNGHGYGFFNKLRHGINLAYGYIYGSSGIKMHGFHPYLITINIPWHCKNHVTGLLEIGYIMKKEQRKLLFANLRLMRD
jgi:hypothetical protein